MFPLARFALIAAVAVLLAAPLSSSAGAEPGFSDRPSPPTPSATSSYLKTTWKADGKMPADLKVQADKLFTTDARAASRLLANVVATDANDAAAWTRLAEALLAIKPDPEKAERYDLPVHASGAAYRGYERAKDKTQKAHALAVLGTALERRSYWRPAIDALKSSIDLVDDQAAREAYDKLRAEHGFRMTDYKVDNEAMLPRLCLQFSEDLSRTQTDVAKFVSVDGKDPQTLTQDGKQLCVEGLTHGQRYQVTARAGLPSEVGETLNKTADIAVDVPDRTPVSSCHRQVLRAAEPRTAGHSRRHDDTKKIAIEVFRIGDRSLATSLQSGDFQRRAVRLRNRRYPRPHRRDDLCCEMDVVPS